MMTLTPIGFNNQHIWGGPTYKQESFETGTWNNVNPHVPMMFAASSQVGIHASNSDDLFLPLSNIVSFYPYTLPDVPSNTAYGCSFSHHPSNTHIPVNRAHLSQPSFPLPPQHNNFSSYKNPAFISPILHSSPHTPDNNIPPTFNPHFQQQRDHFEHHQFPNPNYPVNPSIPMQYIYYVPSPVPQSPGGKTPPFVTHIPLLTSKINLFTWDEAVTLLLCADGIIRHILDPLEPINPSCPNCVPISMPILPPSPTQIDLADLTHWWDTDNTAQHILTA